jgi:pyridoxal/pyridoxine/pyridoxamine kinase
VLQRARSLVIGPGMNILSIQSHVAYGHAGNSAAVFPLQLIGVEVWPVHPAAVFQSLRLWRLARALVSADAIRPLRGYVRDAEIFKDHGGAGLL